MAETRPKDYPRLTDYQPTKFMLPTSHYDEGKADRAVKFIENLRHTKGKWAGKRFWLLPWQEQIIRDIFGIVGEDNCRQFRTAFIEIGKKNGKQFSGFKGIIIGMTKLVKCKKRTWKDCSSQAQTYDNISFTRF